jgi:phage shock protein PspC (stress-responsive transcriptional regulator)
MQFNPVGTWDGLVRPRATRKVAGVCAGLAQRYFWDVALVRVITLLLAVFTFPLGVIAYAVLWIALPEEPLYLPANVASAPPAGQSPSA